MSSEKNPKVDFFFEKAGKWKDECKKLREIALSTNLSEELKWGCPCYASEKSNIVLIHWFKEYCSLLFFKGAVMNDPDNVLIQQTENVQSSRQMRFTGIEQINDMEPVISAYIKEAIRVEKSGLKVEMKKTSEFPMPEEFEAVLKEDKELKKAFEALTPGRQRGYLLHFSQPKQVKTRESRIEKAIPQILDGKGLND